LDHDDVIWNGSKGESSGERRREEKMRQRVLEKNGEELKVLCSRKPHLF